MKIGLVREAGGFGDIICLGGASRALKLEDPSVDIVAFVPKQFVDIALHLRGINAVVSLGSLADITKTRRGRDTSLVQAKDSKYLSVIYKSRCDKYVDLFCPAFLYECTEKGPLRFTRSQLFAMAAGAKSIKHAFPRWKIGQKEMDSANKLFRSYGFSGKTVGVAFRSTCSTRTYPKRYAVEVIKRLLGFGLNVVYFEGASVHFDLPEGVVVCKEPFGIFAGVASRCDVLLTVDSCLLHLGQALRKKVVVIYANKDGKPFNDYCSSITTVDGSSDKCRIPCNYAAIKGWDKRKCRPVGCPRMDTNTPDRVVKAVLSAMGMPNE